MSSRKHVLMIPFPAFGHIIPILELGKKIAQHHDVTLGVATHMLDEIQSRQLVCEPVKLVGISDDFQPETYAPSSDKAKMISDMSYASNNGVKNLVATKNGQYRGLKAVDVVIADTFLAGAAADLTKQGVSFFHLATYSANVYSVVLSMHKDSPIIPFSNPFPMIEISSSTNSSGPAMGQWKHDFLVAANDSLSATTGIVFNTVREIEKDAFASIAKDPRCKNLPLYTVGPIIPVETAADNEPFIQKWLEVKPSSSVVYVSFGTVAWLPAPQIAEISSALLTLGRPFIWSLAPNYQTHLPEEIRSQIKENQSDPQSPYLIVSWAPQKQILKHSSTAVFVSHCGWNSTLETMSFGKPVLAWPMFSDQLINGTMLERKSMALRVKDTGMGAGIRLVGRDEIVQLLTRMVEGPESEGFIRHAKQTEQDIQRALEPDGNSTVEFAELVEFGSK